jgi:hypothetical protein
MVASSEVVEMSDTLETVAERLARLEVTVAEGFHDTKVRFHDMEQGLLTLSRKVDVQTEAIREDLRSAIDAMNTFAEEARRTTDSVRREHAADRAVLTVALQQHARRLHDLEQK